MGRSGKVLVLLLVCACLPVYSADKARYSHATPHRRPPASTHPLTPREKQERALIKRQQKQQKKLAGKQKKEGRRRTQALKRQHF
jgi:hypothetical protein